MNSKKMNKLLNKIIVFLVILVIGAFSKEYIIDKKAETKTPVENIENSKLEIYFFDVGQADSILIKEEDYTTLIDGGNTSDGENLAKYLKDELKLNDIDIVVGTHPHEDHIGGLPSIINSFEIEKIYLPNATTTTKIFEKLLDVIEDKEQRIIVPKINEEIKLNNMNFKVLFTGTDESNLNDSSIVLKLNYINTSYLFTGDATSKIEKKIIKKDITSDVIKIGHHGSSYSTTDNFLDKVNPKYAIIQVGKDNKYNHPSKDTLDKLTERNIITYRTDKDGTIKLTSDGNNINIEKIKTNIDG